MSNKLQILVLLAALSLPSQSWGATPPGGRDGIKALISTALAMVSLQEGSPAPEPDTPDEPDNWVPLEPPSSPPEGSMAPGADDTSQGPGVDSGGDLFTPPTAETASSPVSCPGGSCSAGSQGATRSPQRATVTRQRVYLLPWRRPR